MPTTSPWQAERVSHSVGRRKRRVGFQMLPSLPLWQKKRAGLACQTWQNQSQLKGNLGFTETHGKMPIFFSRAGFLTLRWWWERTRQLIKWGGHWAKEAETPCSSVRWSCEGSQTLGLLSHLMCYIMMILTTLLELFINQSRQNNTLTTLFFFIILHNLFVCLTWAL